MTFTEKLLEAKQFIQAKAPNFIGKVAIILGSGMGPLGNDIKEIASIPYNDIPHFPVSRVQGHASTLVLGTLAGVPVIGLKGRVHMYEGTSFESLKMLIRVVKALGCHTMLITNAVGSLRKEVTVGEIMLVTDHINFIQHNPLIGPNDDDFGPRFVGMNDAYDKPIRSQLKLAAKSQGIHLHEGTYIATMGPCFETPAEIRAFKLLGADVVGMSLIPEVILARHCGLKIGAISGVVNLAAGMDEEEPSHEGTLYYAQFSGEKICKVFKAFLEQNHDELIQH